MKITDNNTDLTIDIVFDDSNQIILSATFFGTPKILNSIAGQLCFLEQLSYETGHALYVERQNNPDGSITITDNCKEALLFIARHQFMNLSTNTRGILEQACSIPLFTPQSANSSISYVAQQTLFRRRVTADQTQPLLPQTPTPRVIQTPH